MTGRTRPDILFIVLDTLRADRLSCYGYSRETTPHIDAFAEDAVLFERAISPAQWTIPAHASLFTGEYPTTHKVTQIYDKHEKDQIVLAELLHNEGYLTAGFCNNPFLGVMDNGLDRGFQEFYSYGGPLANRPEIDDSRPRRTGRMTQRMARVLRRLTFPVQSLFTRHHFLLRIATHPRVVPLWQHSLSFKGNTAQSLSDLVGYLRTRQRKGAERPLFAFVNLMETHLPFRPRPRFVRKFASYFARDREARDFMRNYNLEHYRWMVPLTEPLSELQDRVLNDLYDAEVGYEDHLLRHLFSYLDEPEARDNTLVIITSDHGEGMNHHHFVGHSLVAYDDLVRVPLIVRYPKLYPGGKRIPEPVSTRRIFHTSLEAAGVFPAGNSKGRAESAPVEVERLSLARSVSGSDPEEGVVFAEAYTPDTLIALMENEDPEAIEAFRCRHMRRAAYRGEHKLISVGEEPDELFDVVEDPDELENLITLRPEVTAGLNELLRGFTLEAEARRPANWEASRERLAEDREIAERLRGLGYIE